MTQDAAKDTRTRLDTCSIVEPGMRFGYVRFEGR